MHHPTCNATHEMPYVQVELAARKLANSKSCKRKAANWYYCTGSYVRATYSTAVSTVQELYNEMLLTSAV